MSGRTVLVSAFSAIALPGCVHADDEAATTRSARLSVSGDARVTAPWTAGNLLHGIAPRSGPMRLGGAVNSTLIAGLAPAAVADRSGRLVLYNSWRGRAPVLRVYDVRRRRDRIVATGALSAAWRRDGALAYFAALRREVVTPQRYVGHIVVRRGLDGTTVRWTRGPARYVAAAWARKRLLAYRVGRGWPELLVVDRPGRVRVLDLATGRELGRLQLGRGIRWITESGSWVGDLVFAASSAGLAVFSVTADGVEMSPEASHGRSAGAC